MNLIKLTKYADDPKENVYVDYELIDLFHDTENGTVVYLKRVLYEEGLPNNIGGAINVMETAEEIRHEIGRIETN